MTATTTYLQIVNSSINESGADSATFATNGSDFTTRTDKYMNQFKTWVSRAWRDIQIECYDWDFMQEQGLCTLAPGIMFYTDGTPVSAFASAIANTTVDVYDQNGTVAIPQVALGDFTDLTGVYTLSQPFGCVDLTGGTSTNPLNIALKPGAEYIQNIVTSSTSFDMKFVSSIPAGYANLYISPQLTTWNYTKSYPSGTAIINNVSYPVAFVSSPTNTSFSMYCMGSGDSLPFSAFSSGDPVEVKSSEGEILLSYSGYNGAGSIISTPGPFTIVVGYANKMFVHSWRSYDFNEEIQTGDFQESIEQINDKSFRSIDYLQSPPAGEIPIPFMPWETYRSSYDISSAYPGTPRLVTKDDTGRYRFYPALYYPFSVKFDYSRRPQILSAYSDVPRGINDEFTDLIMWRAINYYGEYMEQPSIIARSERRYKDLLSRLEQKNREMFHFKPVKLW